MKRILYFLSFFVAIFLLVGCAVTESPVDAIDETDVAVKSGKKHVVPFGCEFTMWSEPAIPGPTIHLDVFGSGNATHMGKIAMVVDETINTTSYPWEASASVVLTAANGDELHFDYTSQIDPSDMPPAGNGDLVILGECTVTDGTGRFENASGNFIYNGIFSVITSTGTGSFLGEIMY